MPIQENDPYTAICPHCNKSLGTFTTKPLAEKFLNAHILICTQKKEWNNVD